MHGAHAGRPDAAQFARDVLNTPQRRKALSETMRGNQLRRKAPAPLTPAEQAAAAELRARFADEYFLDGGADALTLDSIVFAEMLARRARQSYLDNPTKGNCADVLVRERHLNDLLKTAAVRRDVRRKNFPADVETLLRIQAGVDRLRQGEATDTPRLPAATEVFDLVEVENLPADSGLLPGSQR
jgi:hypothetical protein